MYTNKNKQINWTTPVTTYMAEISVEYIYIKLYKKIF